MKKYELNRDLEDHGPYGPFYLCSDVDARLAELEQREDLLRSDLYSMYVRAGYAQHEAYEKAFSRPALGKEVSRD